MKHWRARHIPQDTDPNPPTGGHAATVAGDAGPGFHTWPSGHILQDNGSESASDTPQSQTPTHLSAPPLLNRRHPLLNRRHPLLNRRHPLIYRRDWREDHLLALRWVLKGWQHLRAQIDELDTEIARRVRALDEHAAGAQTQREAPAPGSVCVRAPK